MPKNGLAKEPKLYGIENSNRKGKNFFGKNQFNSSFPVALACYMRDNAIKPVYLKVNQNLEVITSEISFNKVFNTELPNEKIRFDFESVYEPYTKYAYNDITGIDLVVKDEKLNPLRALEIKLTVMPDSTTAKDTEADWGTELVIRPASTLYCALGMFDSCKQDANRIKEIFEPVYLKIRDWTNPNEILANLEEILNALDIFQTTYREKQQPFLMQPIWKTLGIAPMLSEQAFDIFIWSDFAVCRTFLDKSRSGTRMTRYVRSSARLARVLYELSNSTSMKTNTERIYTDMSFGAQTDKEFALSGKATREYMSSPRRIKPIMNREVVTKIILNGGVKELSPERRFDQTIYFTTADIFRDENKSAELME
ncbi:HindVP family restriction endonuclease [Bacillus swezeyi]|uniref:HindVP family restriction endonuclease n=1 Tax=Bacillus swezeyi TaxID=1925020 RepID=UPI0039C6D167